MQNDNIDFQNLKRTKLVNPLFAHCSKAIPIHSVQKNQPGISDVKKTFSYVVIPSTVQIEQRVFQCKSLSPIFNCGEESFVLVKGENLWDFYRAKKQNEIIMTEQQLWIFIKQITTALIQLQSFGHHHSHLKQYAIYRQSPFSYQLLYHPHMQAMRELSRKNQSFYWYDFYLSPEQLKVDDLKDFIATGKDTVFALGLLLLNVMNSEDFNRSVYSKAKYQVDWTVIRSKFDAVNRRYSNRLIDLLKNCLKEFPQQRYGFKEVLNYTVTAINLEKTLNLQFKAKFHQLLSSSLNIAPKKPSSRISDSRKNDPIKSSPKSPKSQSPKSPFPSSKQKPQPIIALKQIQIQKFKTSLESKKKTDNSFKSPPKKQKVTLKKTFPMIKPQFNISKQKQVERENFKKNQSVESKQKTGKSLQKHEDVINFQRGTFGGQQSLQISSFSSSKFKKDIKIQIQSNRSESNKDKQKWTLESHKLDNFETQRVITLGEFKAEDVLNPSNSVDSLDSEIDVLDSARRKQQQKEIEQQKYDKKLLPPFYQQSQQIVSRIIEQETQSQGYTLQRLKKSAQALAQNKKLAHIESSLETYTQQITLNLNDCLQPLQILQTFVSNSHGVYIQGNLYFGPFKHGRRNGFGLEIFPENEYYLGNFKDDLFDGEGFYFWNKNEYFLGMFENGKRLFGHLFGPKLHYFGQFLNSKKMNGFGKAKFKNGQEYVGQWKQGRRQGLGKLIQITKDQSIGYWLKGKRSGYAQHISSGYPQQGYYLKAFWKDSDIISQVIIEYENGNFYQGSLNQQLQKHGKGQFIFKKGGYFKGTFYEDNATHGELVYKNGERYVGCLRNMKRHGFGEYHYLDGTVKKGNWVDDIRIQKDVLARERM